MTKVDLLHRLADARGYRHYLEVCTPTTGGLYASVDQARFGSCHRLMYRCPPDYCDGAPIDFRSETDDISGCLAEIRRASLTFDLSLVDPWHTYGASARDIAGKFALLTTGGTMVVHDCLPPNVSMATPEFVPDGWCGLTYQAYLDFVTSRGDLDFFTIDTDYGCGIVRKIDDHDTFAGRLRRLRAKVGGAYRPGDGIDPQLVSAWRTRGGDYRDAFTLFETHKQALLKLTTVVDFQAPVSEQ